MEICPITPADLPAVLHLNQNAMPLVNSLTPAKLAELVEMAAVARLANNDGAVAGFVLALPHTAPYASQFFGWFNQRYPDFLYIDRIVVADWARRQGIGLALLAQTAEWASLHRLTLASDLYADNEPSLAFHLKFGFEPVGRQQIDEKTVLKLLKPPPRD